ncbi:hypothetical protein LOTGIDRAFT_164601 [Lottia gigantea]|uniref:Major facilitator superfamily (MFS) profile domain-containing protein n=1 Tax=Lottia gigantea TaxID=225164 RepID=V4A9F0_LOTGI|nr:hypothetical protein LOTGIDRAFT_164601 [Lottia gigantea]ESO89906.1 hypothetical protein LOTGIDRAFT_164601 [Lottia gigantea]
MFDNAVAIENPSTGDFEEDIIHRHEETASSSNATICDIESSEDEVNDSEFKATTFAECLRHLDVAHVKKCRNYEYSDTLANPTFFLRSQYANGLTQNDQTPEQTPEKKEEKEAVKDTEKDKKNKSKKPTQKLPSLKERCSSWRWRLAIILSMGNFITMALREAMPIAIVCMAGPAEDEVYNTSTIVFVNVTAQIDNKTELITEERETEKEYEFSWDKNTRGLVLSANRYSGFFMPLIGGIISQKFGAKRFIFVVMTIAGISYILIPEMTRMHVYSLISLQFSVGLFTYGNKPAYQDVWSLWSPYLEKVSLASFSKAGANLGNTFSSLTYGFLCTIELDNGWPFIFYIFGSVCLLWCALWFFFVSNSPEEHKFISEEEKKYIIANRVGITGKKKPKTPWKSVLTSRPVWAIIITQTCQTWCGTTLSLFLPLYLNGVLEFSIGITGVIISVQFLFRFVGSLFWGFLSDVLLRKTPLSVTVIRKLVQIIGFVMSAILSSVVTFIPLEYREWAIVVLAFLLFFQSAAPSSSAIAPLDIAPRFAGIITGLFIVVGSSISILVPIVVSDLTFEGRREVEWRIIFSMLSGVYILGSFVYLVFGSSKLQHWATASEKKTMPVKKKTEKVGVDNIVFEIETVS